MGHQYPSHYTQLSVARCTEQGVHLENMHVVDAVSAGHLLISTGFSSTNSDVTVVV
jgi:hypothetical protein